MSRGTTNELGKRKRNILQLHFKKKLTRHGTKHFLKKKRKIHENPVKRTIILIHKHYVYPNNIIS